MPTALATRSSAPVTDAYTDAFVSGFARGAIVTSGVALVGSLVALAFLPARSTATDAANELDVCSPMPSTTVGATR